MQGDAGTKSPHLAQSIIKANGAAPCKAMLARSSGMRLLRLVFWPSMMLLLLPWLSSPTLDVAATAVLLPGATLTEMWPSQWS